jgi:hypothetical protein
MQSCIQVPTVLQNTLFQSSGQKSEAGKVACCVEVRRRETSLIRQEYLAHFWTRDLMAMVWKQKDIYILTNVHPTKKVGSGCNISDLYLIHGRFKS